MKALTRKEKILNGDNIAPLTRPEIFTKKAVNEGGGGGGGNPVITFNFDGFGSTSTYWYFAIVEFDGEDYNALPLMGYGGETELMVGVYAPNGKYVFFAPPIPTSENMYLVFEKPNTSNFSTTVSGNISQETITFSFGSTADAYIITGDCTINISAL